MDKSFRPMLMYVIGVLLIIIALIGRAFLEVIPSTLR